MASSASAKELACATSIPASWPLYRVVGAGEAEPAAGSISYTSPVGSALLGKRVGDVVEVMIPSGLLRLRILEIEV